MFDFIGDMDIDWNVASIAIIMYVVCLVLIWRMFDTNLMKLHIKIITSIVMLPIIYFVTSFMINR